MGLLPKQHSTGGKAIVGVEGGPTVSKTDEQTLVHSVYADNWRGDVLGDIDGML